MAEISSAEAERGDDCLKDLIDRKAGRMKLIDAPVGVFVFHDELVLKTEYMTNIDGVYIPDCYILGTGEKFWGGMKSTEDFKTKYNNLDVEVIDIMPSAHLESKQQATVSSDCVSRQDAIDALRKMQTYKLFSGDDMLLIDQAGAQTELMLLPPSAQPEPKRGRWTGDNACSECGYQPWFSDDIHNYSFCPNCGADMKGDTYE